jgi:hypothetical protein
MIATQNFSKIDELTNKTAGYCDFEFIAIIFDNPNLEIKVAFNHYYTTYPTLPLATRGDSVPSD